MTRRPPILSFLGATGTVTGSRFLVETEEATVLVDCGLYQGLRELRDRNWAPFPVDPETIDAVVLTHAHADHTGYLPVLARLGFSGPVFATDGTAALSGIVLPDAGHLQEEEAAHANRHGYSKHRPALPLFSEADARRCLSQLRRIGFGADVEVAPGVTARFRRAGHILGSATVRLAVDGHALLFSGDLGRPVHPVLRPPEPAGPADTVVVESTYGDECHDDAGALERFRDAIAGALARGGTVVIPAFAVDRTEVVLFHLRRLVEAGEIPEVPVYVDSPMALDALAVYRAAIAERSAEVRPELFGSGDPFDPGHLVEVRDPAESRAIDAARVPSIVVSASGMASGGRVLHHLARRLPDHRCTVLLVGFQAAGTRGRSLADGAREVKMFGRYVPVRAEVVVIPALSVHADRDELLGWLGTAEGVGSIFVVHGEPEPAEALRRAAADRLDCPAVVPRYRERVLLP